MYKSRLFRYKGLVAASLMVMLMLSCTSCGQKPTGDQSQQWPQRDITIIVPYNPGGGYDITARLIQPLLRKYLPKKVNVVVQNVPGAGGKVGTVQFAKSNPDGYTLGIQDPLPLAIMQAEGHLEGIDPKKLTYLGQMDEAPSLLVVGSNSRFRKIEDMKGQNVRFGVTTDTTMGTRALAEAIGANATLVTYNGLPEACLAAARGDVDAVVNIFGSVYKQVVALKGKLVPLLVVGEEREPRLPDVKTSKELGLNLDSAAFILRHVIVGPANMPPEIVRILQEAINKALNDPEFAPSMEKAGYPAVPKVGAELQKDVEKAFAVVEKYKKFLSE